MLPRCGTRQCFGIAAFCTTLLALREGFVAVNNAELGLLSRPAQRPMHERAGDSADRDREGGGAGDSVLRYWDMGRSDWVAGRSPRAEEAAVLQQSSEATEAARKKRRDSGDRTALTSFALDPAGRTANPQSLQYYPQLATLFGIHPRYQCGEHGSGMERWGKKGEGGWSVCMIAAPFAISAAQEARACGKGAFPTDLAGKQCLGLTEYPRAKTLEACQRACCNRPTCSTWNWCDSAECNDEISNALQATVAHVDAECWINGEIFAEASRPLLGSTSSATNRDDCQAAAGWKGGSTRVAGDDKPSLPCLVYSIGIRDDWTFDMAAMNAGCEVHSFDPSIGTEPDQQPVGDFYHFHPWGIGSRNGQRLKIQEFADAHGGMGQVFDFATVLKKLKHTDRRLSLVKMDIEGAEWDVLATMGKSGALKQTDQIILEIHLWDEACSAEMQDTFFANKTGFQDYVTMCKDKGRPSKATVAKWAAALKSVQDAGLKLVDWHDNPLSNLIYGVVPASPLLCCYELVFARDIASS